MRSGFYLGLTLPLLLAMAVNAYGLTTFGKSQSNNVNQQPNPPPQVPRGRECQFESDCAQIVNTSCVPDPLEPKTSRCLCGDHKAPTNAVCKNKYKGVNHACMSNEECMSGSDCVDYKGSRGAQKVCKCSEGYTEVDFECNGGVKLSEVTFQMVAILAIARVLAALAVPSPSTY